MHKINIGDNINPLPCNGGAQQQKTIWKKLKINTKWKSKPQELVASAEATPQCF